MKEIKVLKIAGSFAENKDLAREIRINKIVPALESGKDLILDFDGVNAVTQSFIHALISEVIRKYGSDVLERVSFKNCNENVKKIISIVIEYMQEN